MHMVLKDKVFIYLDFIFKRSMRENAMDLKCLLRQCAYRSVDHCAGSHASGLE